MKRILFFLLVALTVQIVKAQTGSVGIGTTTPNSKAALDISSTTKGLLIPSMTTTQRLLITSPPNGLMVFDTDYNEFYYRDGISWRKILNNTFWNSSTSRKWVYNTTDSIGIGTSVPDERLDVNGNIRSRNNLLADNNVTAQGAVSGAALATGGNILVVGTSLLSGDVTTNSDLIINNTAATLQLKNSNVNKGFFQLSGDNVRMGTNSGNTTGKLIIRNNGADRLAVEADGKLTTPATGDNNSMIPLCYGVVDNDGVLIRGTDNVTVEKIGPGDGTNANYFRITCPGITVTSIITATANSFFAFNFTYHPSTTAKCYLGGTARVYVLDATDEYFSHTGFSFIIYK